MADPRLLQLLMNSTGGPPLPAAQPAPSPADMALKQLQGALQSGQISGQQFMAAVTKLGIDPGQFDLRGPAGGVGPGGGTGY